MQQLRRAYPSPSPRLFAILIAAAAASGCAAPVGTSETPASDPAGELVVTLQPEQSYQTIHNFGASDAWSIQFVGRHWPEAKRQRIADLLFSMEMDPEGSPEGIGLSAWRFNVGAGSARQGRESGIRDRWRRTGSFMREDGTLDPEAQPGQRAFLRLARERGVDQFHAFVNSPPIPLTRNGLAHSSGGDAANIAPERYGEFASFLRDVLQEVALRDGIRFDYLSPMNEPQWDWTGGQEGSPWRNGEIAGLARILSDTLIEAGLETEIEVPETARYNYVYETADKPLRGEQARAFFSPASPDFVGSLPNVAHRIAAHSYFTTFPADTLRQVRRRVHDELRSVDPALELTVSEYCILEDNPVIQGRGRDLGMDAALYMAGVIHADLVDAHATAWQWWLAVSPYDYKDGLVYIDSDTVNGNVYESKMLWTLGHYSRFVRPGMARIAAESASETLVNGTGAEVLVSAYRDPGSSRTVAVLVNRGTRSRRVRVENLGSAAVRRYVTSDESGVDLQFTGLTASDEPILLPSRSVITLVAE